MKLIEAHCVDEALLKGLTLLTTEGQRQGSRNGEVLVMPHPVVTVNHNPMQRVSFNSKRDANPFFHLMEALWMLAGRNDITWLDQFVGDFSKRFGDSVSIHEHPSGLLQHGAYGFRWRNHFDIEGGGGSWPPDQLDKAVAMLKANSDDRRVVIAMWDPVADLGADKKDIPCNTHIYLRIRQEPVAGGGISFSDGVGRGTRPLRQQVLDLTVCCRSNDAVWGCHGANAVQFSMLQEYLAARIGVGVGKLYQLSNNYHAYTSVLSKVWPMGPDGIDRYVRGHATTIPLVRDPVEFDADLAVFFGEGWGGEFTTLTQYANSFFSKVAVPMRVAYAHWRDRHYDVARAVVHAMCFSDWKSAAEDWFARRVHRHME